MTGCRAIAIKPAGFDHSHAAAIPAGQTDRASGLLFRHGQLRGLEKPS